MKKRVSHGLTNHFLYPTWIGMISRVYNKNATHYDKYGGRGIIVCSDWRESPESFIEWALENGYEKHLTLDRIDNDGNYMPSNCRFVNRTIQNRNTRKLTSKNTSGYRGVSLIKGSKKWRAQIKVNKIKKSLGCFLSPLDAAKAYDRYVIENNLEHTTNGSYIAEYSLETK